AGPTLVQASVAEVAVTFVAVKAVGCGQDGGGSHVTSAVQPARTPDPSERNQNVKHPSALVDVNGPGIVVPQKAPGQSIGPFPIGLSLTIGVWEVELPSKTYKPSQVASVLKEVKV